MIPNRPVLVLLALAVLAPLAAAQTPGGPPRIPTSREEMWPAPTAEDWAKPCLITFQRTWADALAVQKETGKAILICINMDGEIASEHWAGVRYRTPEVTKLYEPYVCVIASVYRHTPRDHDDEGNRILCPRFGSVTCGEHIAMEPIVYEKYLDEKRIAPRHIMVEIDGEQKYDIYYRNDVQSIIDDVKKGIETRTYKPNPVVKGDRSLVERVASRDIRDRLAVEEAYRKGDGELRSSLLEAAKKQGAATPLELLRLAVFGLDTDLAKKAREALAKTDGTTATDLILDALRAPMDGTEREALISALARIGETSPRARWLAAVQKGLGSGSTSIDVKAWSKGGGEYVAPPSASKLSELEMERQSRERARRESPDDGPACIALAEASLALAMKARRSASDDPRTSRMFTRHLFEDARHLAEKAKELEAEPWRVDTVLALVSYYRGDPATAYERAGTAVREMPPGEPGWNAMALLTIYAEGRFKAIKKAAKARKRWPPEWLSELDAAYSALIHHPLSTDSQVVWYLEFLDWLGARYRAERFLRVGIERFPESPTLHRRLRNGVLARRGVDRLEAIYEEMLAVQPTPRNLEWFAGYASIVAAEYRRRAGKEEVAVATYGRAIDLLERAIVADPDCKATADLHIALALAGRARLAYEAGDDKAAVRDIIASFERKPDAARTPDGVGIVPAATGKMLLARLVEEKKEELIAKLETALGKLDPALLVPLEDR